MSIYTGLANIVTRVHQYVFMMHRFISGSDVDKFGGIPVPVFLFLFVGIGLSILLKYTRTRMEIYFTGANKRAAWISGIAIFNRFLRGDYYDSFRQKENGRYK